MKTIIKFVSIILIVVTISCNSNKNEFSINLIDIEEQIISENKFINDSLLLKISLKGLLENEVYYNNYLNNQDHKELKDELKFIVEPFLNRINDRIYRVDKKISYPEYLSSSDINRIINDDFNNVPVYDSISIYKEQISKKSRCNVLNNKNFGTANEINLIFFCDTINFDFFNNTNSNRTLKSFLNYDESTQLFSNSKRVNNKYQEKVKSNLDSVRNFIIHYEFLNQSEKASIIQENYTKHFYYDSLTTERFTSYNLNLDKVKQQQLYYKKLTMYSCWGLNEENKFFVILTENYPYSESLDSIVIDKKYMNQNLKKYTHILEDKYRARFLNRMKFNESDSLFIYSFTLDKVFSFNINDLEIEAMLNGYMNAPSERYDFIIGFSNVIDIDIGESIAFVGKENPFQVGKLKVVDWNLLDSLELEKSDYNFLFDKSYSNSSNAKIYKYEMDSLEYFIQNYHLIIRNINTNKIVMDKYYSGGEGVTLIPIGNKSSREWDYQRTGQLFKNEPPIIYKFQWFSFGCPIIDFIDEEGASIYIQCDNRH